MKRVNKKEKRRKQEDNIKAYRMKKEEINVRKERESK